MGSLLRQVHTLGLGFGGGLCPCGGVGLRVPNDLWSSALTPIACQCSVFKAASSCLKRGGLQGEKDHQHVREISEDILHLRANTAPPGCIRVFVVNAMPAELRLGRLNHRHPDGVADHLPPSTQRVHRWKTEQCPASPAPKDGPGASADRDTAIRGEASGRLEMCGHRRLCRLPHGRKCHGTAFSECTGHQ